MHSIILTPHFIEAFRTHLRQQEKSPYTIEKYVRDALSLMRFAKDRPLSKDIIISFKSHLTNQSYTPNSINSMLASINSLLTFLEIPQYKVENLRVQRQTYRSEKENLSKAEFLRLKKAAKEKTRLSLILDTLCETGIRISELQYFTVESLQEKKIEVRCKGKIRTIIVPGDLCKKLLRYAKARGIHNGAVFCTRSGKAMNRSNIWTEMKKLCEKANVEKSKVFPHNLRKLFARTFYVMSKDIAQLADILGHSSINTTRIYIMVTEQEVRNKVEKLARQFYRRN